LQALQGVYDKVGAASGAIAGHHQRTALEAADLLDRFGFTVVGFNDHL
jgi:hypothetical protein